MYNFGQILLLQAYIYFTKKKITQWIIIIYFFFTKNKDNSIDNSFSWQLEPWNTQFSSSIWLRMLRDGRTLMKPLMKTESSSLKEDTVPECPVLLIRFPDYSQCKQYKPSKDNYLNNSFAALSGVRSILGFQKLCFDWLIAWSVAYTNTHITGSYYLY